MIHGDSVHTIAQSGFANGTNELYDRARPSYPLDALKYIRQEVPGVSGSFDVVEIGSGTGIFTRAMLAHPDWASAVRTLTAVEPSEGMRAIFGKSVQDERVSCQNGSFENTGVTDNSADLVVVAQAFHWCQDYDAAAAEFERILKPGGIVALIWNLEDRETAWVAQVRDLIEQFEQGTPQFRLDLWRALFGTQSFQDFFHPHKERSWCYPLVASLDIVIDRAMSKSYIAVQPEDIKVTIKDVITEIVDRGDGKQWIDGDKGLFEYPYTTLVVVFQRK